MDQFLERLVSPVSSFLSLLFRLISIWSTEALHVYLFARASKTYMRGSPRQGTSAIQAGACGLRRRCKSLVSGLYWLPV